MRRRYLPLQREIFALIAFLIIVLVLVQLYRKGRVSWSSAWAVFAALILIVYSLVPLGSTHLDLTYFIGDLMILTFLLALLLASHVMPELFESRVNRVILLSFLGLAMIVAPVVQAVLPANDQIVPPHMFLMAATWAGVAMVHDGRARSLLIGLLVLELLLSYYSGQRTNVVLWVVFGLIVFVLRSTIRQKALALLGVMAIGVVLLGAATDVPRQLAREVGASVIADTRFLQLQDGPDESLLGRYLEVRDVWLNMTHDWDTGDWILGVGHGATFRPFFWYPERNMKNGRTHNIHFGPMLVFYRYGVVGLGVFLAFAVYVGVRLMRSGGRHKRDPDGWWDLTVDVACVGGILTFLLFNALQDPVIAFTIAAFLGPGHLRGVGEEVGAPLAGHA